MCENRIEENFFLNGNIDKKSFLNAFYSEIFRFISSSKSNKSQLFLPFIHLFRPVEKDHDSISSWTQGGSFQFNERWKTPNQIITE